MGAILEVARESENGDVLNSNTAAELQARRLYHILSWATASGLKSGLRIPAAGPLEFLTDSYAPHVYGGLLAIANLVENSLLASPMSFAAPTLD